MKNKIVAIDLFSGAGGLSEGFLQTDCFDFVAHVEWEKPMVDTLRTNLVKRRDYTEEEAKESVIRFDIQRVEELVKGNWSQEAIDEYGSDNSAKIVENGIDGLLGGKKVDVIIGGPPCQAYSIAGRYRDSMKTDYRNYLFESFVKVVDHYRPKFFVFENVPGMLSAKPGDIPVLDRIYAAFENIGYEIRKPSEMKKSVYSAADFEVPQDRHRVIIFGVDKKLDISVEKLYKNLDLEKSNNPRITVRQAIGDLPKIKPLEKPYKEGNRNYSHEILENNNLTLHQARYHNKRDIKVFETWITNNMNVLSNEKKVEFYNKIAGKNSKNNKYRNIEWDKPSPTIVAHLYKDGLMFIHPDAEQLRSITVREAALLQSFPLDYEFVGSMASCYKMIGNAVPVNFAKHIAFSIIKIMGGCEVGKYNILIACEESQRVCSEFRKLGFNAYSCDLLPCSGGHPEWHFQQDVLEIIQNGGGVLQNGEKYYISGKWDLMVAHPPCTFLAVSGAKWYYHPDDKDKPIDERRPHPKFPNRAQDREDGANFFMSLANSKIERIAIENPVGIMNTRWRKPDQVVQPWQFGDSASKKTCLWLKNLPLLHETEVVDEGEYIQFGSGRRIAKWYSDGLTKTKTPEERRTWRSKTFPGFAKAIAEQWGKYLVEQEENK